MTALLTIAEIRSQIQSNLTDNQLLDVAAREQAYIESFYGDATASRTELLTGGKQLLTLRRPISSITSIYQSYTDAQNHSTATLLVEGTDYRIYKSEALIERRSSSYSFLPEYRGGMYPLFLNEVEITWTPTDDTYERKACLLDLIRLSVSRTAMQSEQVGEYRYTAPDWEKSRVEILNRLKKLLPRI